MSEPETTSLAGFDFHGEWKAFHVPLPVKVEQDIDYGYRAFSNEPFCFGVGPTPEVALESLRDHLGKQYEFAKWAAEMID